MLKPQLLLQEIKWTSLGVYSGPLPKTTAKKSSLYIYPGNISPHPPLSTKCSVLKSLDLGENKKILSFTLMKISSSWFIYWCSILYIPDVVGVNIELGC